MRYLVVIMVLWCVGQECNAQGVQLRDSVPYIHFQKKRSGIFNTTDKPATHQQVPVFSFSSSFINPGFFCRQEVKMDRKLPLPLRFRLGSLQYCNWLEQKPGYTSFPQ